MPTPPAAPCTSTVSPGWTRAASWTQKKAVINGTPDPKSAAVQDFGAAAYTSSASGTVR